MKRPTNPRSDQRQRLQSTPRRGLKPRPERPEPAHFVHGNRLADAPDARRADSFENEIAFDQPPHRFAHHHRAGTRRLHASGQIGGMADRGVFGMSVATLIGIFIIPVFYVLVQGLQERLLGKHPAPEAQS